MTLLRVGGLRRFSGGRPVNLHHLQEQQAVPVILDSPAVRMVRAQRFFKNRQRPVVERPGLFMLALGFIKAGKVVRDAALCGWPCPASAIRSVW